MPTAQEFLQMARDDVEACMATNVPNSICFHAQQAAEKYLKAFLVSKGSAAPCKHDILELIDYCIARDQDFLQLRPLAQNLSVFAVDIRYKASKREADRRCPEAWNALLRISEMVQHKTGTASGC